jgi:N-dimethylarginine dimethylaminohydrolase
MVKPLKSVLLFPPASAGWGASAQRREWKGLGYLHEPISSTADEQHRLLRRALESAGCEIRIMGSAEGLTLDAVYVHDASFMTDRGAICLRMGKAWREAEPAAHRVFYEANGIPVPAIMEKPCSAEAGDIVWLDSRTLLIGRGYRTNAAGIEWFRGVLSSHGVTVIPAPLPHGTGPQGCLHLMSLMSLLDETTVLADTPLLAVETTELLHARGFRFVEIDPSERTTLAANVLSLGNGRLLALEENPLTNARLRGAGFEVVTFPGAEIGINGGGGPTCLTRPLLRS